MFFSQEADFLIISDDLASAILALELAGPIRAAKTRHVIVQGVDKPAPQHLAEGASRAAMDELHQL